MPSLRVRPLTVTRTNCPGISCRSGLGTTARAFTVPVPELTKLSVKSTTPLMGYWVPSPKRISVLSLPSGGNCNLPLFTPSFSCVTSVSGTAKFTYTGSSWVSLVSRLEFGSLATTRLPSERVSLLATPEIGAITVV
ncbi:hypothetical protein D3C78_1595620 [compost metagenome]